MRITVLVTLGMILGAMGVSGATLGIATLFSGFIAEATTVVIAYHCCRKAAEADTDAVDASGNDSPQENYGQTELTNFTLAYDACFDIRWPWTDKLISREN